MTPKTPYRLGSVASIVAGVTASAVAAGVAFAVTAVTLSSEPNAKPSPVYWAVTLVAIAGFYAAGRVASRLTDEYFFASVVVCLVVVGTTFALTDSLRALMLFGGFWIALLTGRRPPFRARQAA